MELEYGLALTLEEWREYFRRNYLRELHRYPLRLLAGWTEPTAITALNTAEQQLTTISKETRKVTNAHA